MSYTKLTDFAIKDSLLSGNPAKVIRGAEIDAEFNAIASAITSAPLVSSAGASLVGYLPAGAGAVATTVQEKLRESVSVKDFDAVGDGVTDDTAAINAALAASNHVIFPKPSVAYKMTSKLITNGHRIEGIGRPCEVYGTSPAPSSIIEFSGVVGDCVLNTGSKSEYKNIWFRAKDWSTACNGLYLERFIEAQGCMFTHFNGYGAYFNADPATPDKTPYHASFSGCTFVFNAKHGVAVLNGANALTFIDCQSRWNGSPSYGVQPSVAGVYDGLYVNGKEAGFPASATEFEPQQLLVIGGDYSYNSRYGQNYVRVVDSATFGGYIEGNKVSDLSIAAMYGSVICNPMTQQGPTLALVQQDPTTPSMNLLRFPNSIIVRGYDYGTGIKQAGSGVSGYTSLLKTLVAAGSSGEVRILPTVAGGVSVESGENLAWGFGSTVRMGAIRWSLGSFGLTNTSNINFLSSPIGVTENDPICSIINGGQYGEFSVANGGGANAAATFFKAPKNSVTLRSINAGGTVNASGADYAEYERNNGLIIAKGDLVGFKADGTLTHIYEESIRFGIKSTNPSYVGGDTWGNEESLGMSKPEAQSDDFDRALESARQQVDRIAYSGKVPCNVLGASPGGYIIASEEDSRIVGKFVYDPDFEQYKKAVGRVNRILEDGRCEVAVMVH